jgi:hypothetical protein
MQKEASKAGKIGGVIGSVLCLGIIGTIGWALHYGGMWRFPWESSVSAVTQSNGNLSQLKELIAAVDPRAQLVVSVTNGRTQDEATVTVTNQWLTLPYQTRLQTAQSFQMIWAKVYAPTQPDKARVRLVDLNGNEVGGSGAMGGTLVDVKK